MIEFIIGVVIGITIAVIFNRRTYGTLRIFIPDDAREEPFLYAELNDQDAVTTIGKKKYVRFKVNMREI